MKVSLAIHKQRGAAGPRLLCWATSHWKPSGLGALSTATPASMERASANLQDWLMGNSAGLGRGDLTLTQGWFFLGWESVVDRQFFLLGSLKGQLRFLTFVKIAYYNVHYFNDRCNKRQFWLIQSSGSEWGGGDFCIQDS